MEIQSKKKSFWSSFKNAYLRSKNLKKFWNQLDKSNLSEDLIKTFDLYIDSESYQWSSKFWRHLTMNQLNLLANKKYKNQEHLISQEYFTFTYFNDSLIKDAFNKIKDKKIDLNVDLFKRQNNFSITQSINHNIILLLLYENIKSKKIFNNLNKLVKKESENKYKKLSLNINNLDVTQDDLNSLFEFEQIENLLDKISKKNGNFLEIGSGEGRTAKAILSLKEGVKKYVLVDIPPAINTCLKNLKFYFPNKKIINAFDINNQKDLILALEKNDVLFIFPHQLNLFPKKTFDISIAVDCLHEMEKETIKKYMNAFENVSKLLYFKVWENAGLPYSHNIYYSVHNKNDYHIKEHWKEHLKERCLYPSNFFHLGYEF